MSDKDTKLIPVPAGQLSATADYIKFAQVCIEKVGSAEENIRKKAATAVETLVQRGCLHENLKEATVQRFIDDPSSMLDVIASVADRVQADSVGMPTEKLAESTGPKSDQVFVDTLTGSRQEI